MLTVEALRAFGANVDEGLQRCMDNEAFYLKMVQKLTEDDTYQRLQEALEAKDLDGAFEAAHALKGVHANLAMTPIFQPLHEMTELLRSRADMDYTELLEQILTKKEELKKLCE